MFSLNLLSNSFKRSLRGQLNTRYVKKIMWNSLCNITRSNIHKSTKYYGMVMWLVVVVSIFNFRGILCWHVLTIFLHKDCFQIPVRYLPLHWCHDKLHRLLTAISMFSKGRSTYKGPSIDNVGYEVVDFIRNPPSSTTKGCPRTKRSKGRKELAKKAGSCTCCKRSGHNVTTCPDKENHVPSTVRKKRKKVLEFKDSPLTHTEEEWK